MPARVPDGVPRTAPLRKRQALAVPETLGKHVPEAQRVQAHVRRDGAGTREEPCLVRTRDALGRRNIVGLRGVRVVRRAEKRRVLLPDNRAQRLPGCDVSPGA